VKTVWFVVLLVVAVAAGIGGKYLSVRRQLMKERESVTAAWSQAELAVQRRGDLIPELLATIQGSVDEKSPAVQDLIAARVSLASSRAPEAVIAANAQLSNALTRLLLFTESYPKLRSNRGFRRAQFEMGEAENRIAVERRKYNENLEHYNSSIELFPNNLVAAVAGFTRDDDYFRTEREVRGDP
jgi:LemA protein